MPRDAYVLRPRDPEELVRLELQHRVWKDETDAVVRLAGFGEGDRLLDVGCGPGFLSFDLAERVGPNGTVVAVDGSERFIRHLRREAEARRLDTVRAVVADVRDVDLEEASFDGAICRWVLMFVAEPERVVANVARALRPGGVFAVMEYVQFRTLSLWPRGERFRRLYDAVHELIARSGGDADVGGRVPELVQRAGLDVVELRPILRVGRPGSPLWRWLEATNANHPNLVDAALLTASELEAYTREWEERAGDPGAFFVAAPVLATIARKRADGG